MEIKMDALIFSLSNSLKSRDSAKTLASHLSMWIATSSSPFALPGLMASWRLFLWRAFSTLRIH